MAHKKRRGMRLGSSDTVHENAAEKFTSQAWDHVKKAEDALAKGRCRSTHDHSETAVAKAWLAQEHAHAAGRRNTSSEDRAMREAKKVSYKFAETCLAREIRPDPFAGVGSKIPWWGWALAAVAAGVAKSFVKKG